MTGGLSADTSRVTADTSRATADGRAEPFGCPSLGQVPPSVADRMSSPSADDLLPQILALTPRGAAWGTDEAGDGSGASPVQRGFWRGIAAFAADVCTRDFALLAQVFPSAVTTTLPAWEEELGLPDPCLRLGDTASRVGAVRARFAGLGPVSPADFVCLAASVGYSIEIEEPLQFRVDRSACIDPGLAETWFVPDGSRLDGTNLIELGFVCDDGACDDTPVESCLIAALGQGDPLEGYVTGGYADPGDEVAGMPRAETAFLCDDGACDDTALEDVGPIDPNGTVSKVWVAHLASEGDTFFVCDDGECGFDPIEGFVNAPELECLMQARTPPHTRLIFNYAP